MVIRGINYPDTCCKSHYSDSNTSDAFITLVNNYSSQKTKGSVRSVAKLGLILTINKEDLVSKVKLTIIPGKLTIPCGSVKYNNAGHGQRS